MERVCKINCASRRTYDEQTEEGQSTNLLTDPGTERPIMAQQIANMTNPLEGSNPAMAKLAPIIKKENVSTSRIALVINDTACPDHIVKNFSFQLYFSIYIITCILIILLRFLC